MAKRLFVRDREHAVSLDTFCLRYGRNPRLVAEQISRLVNGSPQHLRYPVGFDAQYILFVHAILPERVFQFCLRWFLLGGQTLKLTDDDDTLRRKMGFRHFMFETPLSGRLSTGTALALGLLVLVGLAWWLL